MNRFYFIPKENLTYLPTPTNNIITANITASTDWFAGHIIKDTDDFSYQQKSSIAGNQYTVSLKGKMPLHSPETEALFFEKSNREFLLVVINQNDVARVLGNKIKGLRFSFQIVPDGYEYEYTGVFDAPQPFYSGSLPVDGTTVGNTYTPASSYIRAARWLFGTGAPASSLGSEWDIYLDNSTTNYYEKIAGTWVLVAQMVNQRRINLAFHYAHLTITNNR